MPTIILNNAHPEFAMKPSASCSTRLAYYVFLCLVFCLWLPTIVLAIEGEEDAAAEHVPIAAEVHLPAEDAEGRENDDKVVTAEKEQEVQLTIHCTSRQINTSLHSVYPMLGHHGNTWCGRMGECGVLSRVRGLSLRHHRL